MTAYERGPQELGYRLYAYLQPDGTSLLVDTLFDLTLTRDMLAAMPPVTDPSPIGQGFNTHGNSDHRFGNALLPIPSCSCGWPTGAPVTSDRSGSTYHRGSNDARRLADGDRGGTRRQ